MATHYQSAMANVKNLFQILFHLFSSVLTHTFDICNYIIMNYLFNRLPICCAFSGPCLYIWLNFGSPVDAELYDQYKFGCICIVVSGIIELLAEVPVFVAQVFCFVKLRVILDTLNIFVRSIIFVVMVIHDPTKAIFAFSIAQVGSTVAFVIGYYIYFIHYTRNAKESSGALKRSADNLNDNAAFDGSSNNDDETTKKHAEQEDFIPFNNIKQMLPGCLHNPVYVQRFHLIVCLTAT